jgi:hypothetical protein
VPGLQAQLQIAWDTNDELRTTIKSMTKRIDDLKMQLRGAAEEHERELGQARAHQDEKKGCCVVM